MSDALALLDGLKAGLAPQGPPASLPKCFARVERGPELLRILQLPRRPAPRVDCPDAAALATFLTGALATRPDPYPGALRPLQAAALQELWSCRGLAAFIRVGGGKMLLSYLAETALQTGGNVVLVAPGQMWNDPATAKHFRQFERSWRGPKWGQLTTVSYERLANPENGEDLDANGDVIAPGLLDQLRPSLIVLDEAHKAGRQNIAHKRLARYKRHNPQVPYIPMTGSPFNTSIMDAAYLLEWALGDKSPLPRPSCGYPELEAWGMYLDVSDGPRVAVGELLQFLTPADLAEYHREWDGNAKRKVVRRAVARWMYDSPGVISSQEGKLVDDDGRVIELELSSHEPRGQSAEIDEFFLHLRGDKADAAREGRPRATTDEVDDGGKPVLKYPGWHLPDGSAGADGLWFQRHADTGGFGFWMRYADPAPSKEYLLIRSTWAAAVRQGIKNNGRGIDSEARMERAVRKGLYPDMLGLLELWDTAQADFTATTGLKEPRTEAVWLTDEAVRSVSDWVQAHNGLVWVRYTELGNRLARELGIPFYRQGAKDAKSKRHITEHRGGAAVVSVQSAKEGKNLQGLWSSNLWMVPPHEQSLARTHRAGQKADVVRNWIYIGCYEHLASYYRARDAKAEFHGDMTLQAQKLTYAVGEVPTLAAVAARATNRWTKEILE